MTTVVTQLKFPQELYEQIDDITSRSVEVFKNLKGFVSVEINMNAEKNSTLSYLQWESYEDHENCMKHPSWEEMNPEWSKIMNRDDVDFQFLFIGEPKWVAK